MHRWVLFSLLGGNRWNDSMVGYTAPAIPVKCFSPERRIWRTKPHVSLTEATELSDPQKRAINQRGRWARELPRAFRRQGAGGHHHDRCIIDSAMVVRRLNERAASEFRRPSSSEKDLDDMGVVEHLG